MSAFYHPKTSDPLDKSVAIPRIELAMGEFGDATTIRYCQRETQIGGYIEIASSLTAEEQREGMHRALDFVLDALVKCVEQTKEETK